MRGRWEMTRKCESYGERSGGKGRKEQKMLYVVFTESHQRSTEYNTHAGRQESVSSSVHWSVSPQNGVLEVNMLPFRLRLILLYSA